jgi:hypothetical protein
MKRIFRPRFASVLAGCFAATAVALVVPSASAAVCAGKPADRTLALLFMESNGVATGTLRVAKGEVTKASDDGLGGYIDLPIDRVVSIAGKIPPRILVKTHAERVPYGVQPEQVERLAGKPVLVFLRGLDGDPYFFANGEALQPATPDTIEAAKVERDRQWRILKAWRADPLLAHYEEVRSLVSDLAAIPKPARDDDDARDAARERQREIFAKLEGLGMAAVPAIVAHMDDRRPLSFPEISLVNFAPDAFEGIRHYGPEQIVDALAAILNQVAGPSFEFIYNGGTEAERRSAVHAWRIFADDLICYGK